MTLKAAITSKKTTRVTYISRCTYTSMPIVLGCFLLIVNIFSGGVGAAAQHVSISDYGPQFYVPNTSTTTGFLSYYNPTTGISIQYPAHWQSFAVAPPVAAAFGNPHSYSGLTVIVFAPATSADIEIQNLINSHSVMTPGFQLVSSGVGEVAGMPAQTIFFNFIDPAGYQAAAIQSLVTSSNGIGYVVSYMFYPSLTDSEEISDIQTMFASLQVNDSVLMYNTNYMNSGSGSVVDNYPQQEQQPSPYYGGSNNINDWQNSAGTPPTTDTGGSSIENPANRATDEIIDESIGGYAGGLEMDGEIHRWDGSQDNVYGDTSGDP